MAVVTDGVAEAVLKATNILAGENKGITNKYEGLYFGA